MFAAAVPLIAIAPTAAAQDTDDPPFAEELGPACYYGMILHDQPWLGTTLLSPQDLYRWYSIFEESAE